MKVTLLSGLMLLAGISVSSSALAEHGRGGHAEFGVYLGAPYPYYDPYYYPRHYYPDPYYYPPVVVVPAPAQPPVYTEQNAPPPATQVAPAPQATNYWYHCDKPEGYYPYIKECPAGWQKVSPTPPPQ